MPKQDRDSQFMSYASITIVSPYLQLLISFLFQNEHKNKIDLLT